MTEDLETTIIIKPADPQPGPRRLGRLPDRPWPERYEPVAIVERDPSEDTTFVDRRDERDFAKARRLAAKWRRRRAMLKISNKSSGPPAGP